VDEVLAKLFGRSSCKKGMGTKMPRRIQVFFSLKISPEEKTIIRNKANSG